MKKSIIAAVLAVLCLSLVSCNRENDETSSVSSAVPSEPAYSSVPSEAEENDTETTEESSSKSVSSKASSAATSSAAEKKSVRVTIPEGYSLSQIGDKLEAAGVCKKADLLSVSNTYDFSYYSLIAAIPANENRCYKLEGYLYPNTYDFYLNMKPQDALGLMLRGAESKIGSKYTYSGLTTDEIITIASIIEKECARKSEMANVSSVIHNRLNKKMKLQMDATIYYVERYLKPNLSGDINRYNSFYNTYKCPALPAGPICNPSANALNAAVNPADTDYLYFSTDENGTYSYSKDLKTNSSSAVSSEP